MSSSDSKILGVPKVTCLCATKGRYELLRSAVSYFLLQDYPNKELLIFNNHPEPIKLSSFVEEQHNIHIINAGEFSSIADVYNTALTYVDTWGGPPTEFVAIWDDDDIYFPWHLSTGLKHLVKGTHHAWQPREQLYIDASYEHYPKINAIRNHCEGSMVVKYSTLSSVGFGPASNADEHGQQHPHPRWCERINELGGFTYSEKDENSYAYFWGGQEDRQKPWYVHLTNGGFEGNTQNNNTGDGSPLYPGPTYYDFISKNLYLKKYDEEYTAEEKEAVVTRLDSYDWSFFEERKLFTFWEGEKPYFIERCLESMEKNSNCIFEVWDTEKLKQTYSDIPKEYDSLTVESKSDYFRQKVLYEEGGMWLDADMFIVGDLYESIMKYTWWYDQVQPLENPDCNSINICAMACRPRSQVFKKALESVNAIMPLNTTGWADLINYSAKYAIRERDCRGLVKYIPETVISLKFVQNSKGGFSELYSSTEMSLDEIVLPDTAVVTLHSSQIRHEQKDIMPKDYLLQRLLDKYTETKLLEDNTPVPDIPLGELIDTVKHSIHSSVNCESNLDTNGCIPSLGCPQSMSSAKVKHLFNNVLSRLPKDTRYLEIGCWEGGIFIPAMYNNNHIKPTVIDIFTDPNGVECHKLDCWEHHEITKKAFFINLKAYIPHHDVEVFVRDCFEESILPINRKYNVYFYDGPHDFESQKRALTHYLPHLNNMFIYIVDDYEDPPVKSGTLAGIAECGFKVHYSHELFSRWNGDTSNYWNGVGVFVLEKQRLIDTYCPSTLPQTITRLTDRNEMDNLIRSLESPVIAEVGVQAGTNFQLLLTENVKEAVAVDIWDKSETVAQNDQGYSKETLEGLYINFVRHHMADARVKVFKGFSVDVAKVFPDGYFDFIYIDADHTYEGCLADLRAWYPKIKQGGIIAGHDYIDIVGGHNDDVPFGVIQAVTEFSNQHALDVHITKESFASYFMVKPMTTSSLGRL